MDSGADDFYAHSLPDRPQAEWEPLEEHLQNVAERSREFAAAFGSGEWGYLAGLWHDLGKYRPLFQRRIRGESVSAPHAVIGAVHATNSGHALPLAFVIAGHHAGLTNLMRSMDGAPRPLREQLKEAKTIYAEIDGQAPANVLVQPIPQAPQWLSAAPGGNTPQLKRRLALWTRFLFSALVDADYLCTETFMSPERAAGRRHYTSVSELKTRLDAHIERVRRSVPKDQRKTEVNRAREDVLRWCEESAPRPPGLFSLTVPTGGGKTLSGMAFALNHAARHDLRRVIVALPYTSIIEQNAAVYRDALGSENVVEHHSNLDPQRRSAIGEEASRQHDRATENWDAPVIVTTTVQFFESLFANRPSRCRKLHNIARSVIILDEVQTLPPWLLLPVLDALNELISTYGCTVVLSTATPPALARRQSLPTGLPEARPIIQDPASLYTRLDRVEIEWRTSQPLEDWAILAQELAELDQLLVIVDRRADALALAEALQSQVDEHVFHLSTLMCPKHRMETIQLIKETLEAGQTCRVVSTQLVEAGVDLDFPVVYRATAGLDRVLQAAGRCNREGRLQRGRVVVFEPPKPPPPGDLRGAYDAMHVLLNEFGQQIPVQDLSLFDRFFRLYYGTPVDRNNVLRECQNLNFASTASVFKLIDDSNQVSVVVPWGDGEKLLDEYRCAEELGTLTRAHSRALQPYVVQLYARQIQPLIQDGSLEPIGEKLYAVSALYRSRYDSSYGLQLGPDFNADPTQLMV